MWMESQKTLGPEDGFLTFFVVVNFWKFRLLFIYSDIFLSVPELLILNSLCCCWRKWASAGVLLDRLILDIFTWEEGHCLLLCLSSAYGSNLDYPQRCTLLHTGHAVSGRTHLLRTWIVWWLKHWTKTLDQTGQVKARQVDTRTQKNLAIGALSPGLSVWWISVRVVTTNLLNEKPVQDFVFALFCLCQGGKKSSQKINLNLWTSFLFTELGSPADFCLIAEVLDIPFQELWRYVFSIIHTILPDSPSPITLTISSAPYPHPLLPVSRSCFFIFSPCSCLVSFAHCFVSLTAMACDLQGLSVVWICLSKRGPRSHQPTQRTEKTNHPKQDRQENIQWIFLCAHK